MDPDQAKAEATAEALQRDVKYLEHEAAVAGKSLAKKLGPPVAAFVLLAVVAWVLGRRSHARKLRAGMPTDLDLHLG